MKTNLENRLKTMLCGRKIHAWGSQIGLTRGVINNLNKGKLPNADKLGPVVRSENLSLSWLIDGRGKPYMVNSFADNDEASDYTTALLDDEKWQVKVVTDEVKQTLVLTQTASYFVGDKPYPYICVEIVTGNTRADVCKLIKHKNAQAVVTKKITTLKLRQLSSGQIGTYQLFNAPQALLNNATELDAADLTHYSADTADRQGNSVSEAAPLDYSTGERGLVESYRQLDDDWRRLLIKIVSKLINNKKDW